MSTIDHHLPLLKSLADATRLRIVGLLAHRPYAVEELATVLELKASTVSYHLSRMTEAELVRSEAHGHYHVYALQLEVLQARLRELASARELRALAPQVAGEDPYERKVLSTFLGEDGRITAVPMKRKKFAVLLRYALRLFEDEGPWHEREVNRRLEGLFADTATLRRGFIDHGLMVREKDGSGYRRV